MWNLLRDLGTRLLRDLTGSSRERQELLAAQIRLNERETENAPSSVLRLWRSFLGWVLALLFCWEVPVRLPLSCPCCWPWYRGCCSGPCGVCAAASSRRPNICAAAGKNSDGKPCGCAASICWNRLWRRNGNS